MQNEAHIREQVERWVAAIQARDLDGVLADRSDDVVMFDVPPPYRGARGMAEYRDTWPQFFEWLAQGAVFELESLDVVAGEDVAFAYALLRCGMPDDLAAQPELRLRLTLGFSRTDGRWVVRHEHHSFPDTTIADAQQGEADIRELHQRWFASTTEKDLDGLMACIADDVVSYEHDEPLEYVGVDAVREVCREGLEAVGEGEVGWEVPDMSVLVQGDLAVAWGLNRMTARMPGGDEHQSWSRGTRVFRRRAGRWELVHQQLSYPRDPATGTARTDLTPSS